VPAFELPLREYSDWKELGFDAGLKVSVKGIARFYLMSLDPEVHLYMTPIHIDPENPAMPISHPESTRSTSRRSRASSRTLGLAEDTWSLNERVVDERAFFEQAMLFYEERERMFLDAREADEEGARDDGLRHDGPRPAHVLPLPGPDAPRERGQGHRGVEGRDLPRVRAHRRAPREVQKDIDDPDTAF
jgi:hypothetical protein